MRAAVLGVAVVAACCPDGPTHLEREPPPGADLAIELVRAEYREAFDLASGRDRNVRVRWTDSPWRMYGKEVAGASWGCRSIWVAVPASGKLSESGLAHELAHCYAGDIQHCGLRRDNSHSEDWIWGQHGVVKYAKAVLVETGL